MDYRIFLVFSLSFIVIDIAIAFLCLRKKRKDVVPLSMALFMIVVAQIAYLGYVMNTSVLAAAISFSIHCCALDAALILVMLFVIYLIGGTPEKYRTLIGVMLVLTITAMVMIIVGSYTGNVLGFAMTTDPARPLPTWVLRPQPVYYVHLAFNYTVMATCIIILIVKMCKIPAIYINKYLVPTSICSVIVVTGAVYIFIPTDEHIDYSTLLYNVFAILLYWSLFMYSPQKTLIEIRQTILNEMATPVVLFDYDQNFMLSNKYARDVLLKDKDVEIYSLQEFIAEYKLGHNISDIEKGTTFQWQYKVGDEDKIYRCDYSLVKDKKQKTLGYMFIFTDYSLATDVLTGFVTENNFMKVHSEYEKPENYPIAVLACDINNLANINRIFGANLGDKAISTLADVMKKNCSEHTVFVRLHDANLCAIATHTTAKKMYIMSSQIRKDLQEIQIEGLNSNIDIQSAVAIVSEKQPYISEGIRSAMDALKTKKMMDKTSAHSSLLESLAQAQLESDNTTREHVERTSLMGRRLGERLGLSEDELNKLRLLCLLHDIGKVGIPLEILNKPGKLNAQEWEVMQTHVEKGYRITNASDELSPIADAVLHHHESWDGSGYPDHMKGENIPLLSRIVAVVDSYDAMTNNRAYSKARSHAKAREEIKRCSGTQFDPYIVSEFLALLDDMGVKDDKKAEGAIQIPEVARPMGIDTDDNIEVQNTSISKINYTRYVLEDDLRIIQIADDFESLTGYTRDEALGLSQLDLILPEDIETYKKKVVELLDQESKAFVAHRLQRKDSSVINVHSFYRKYYDAVSGKTHIDVVITDVSRTYSN